MQMKKRLEYLWIARIFSFNTIKPQAPVYVEDV